MHRRWLTFAHLITLLALVGGLLVGADPRSEAAPEPAAGEAVALAAAALAAPDALTEPLVDLPVTFEPNQGQADDGVAFIARGAGYRVDLTPTDLALTVGTADVRMQLVGANPNAHVRGQDVLHGRVNHLIGNDPSQWHTGIRTYGSVFYESVYPGIDLVVRGNPSELEYDFVVAPGADPDAIALAFPDADSVTLDASGDLVLTVADQTVLHRRPFIYQDFAGEQVAVAGTFAIDAARRVGFELAGYDTTMPLIIDPVIEYSTNLGGTGNEDGLGVAVDAEGNAYVVGSTTSTDFPVTTTLDGEQAGYGGGAFGDAFVAKLDPNGTQVYATYLGGSGNEDATRIGIDGDGNVVFTGLTTSSDFPTVNAHDDVLGGGLDAYVAKLSADGSQLVYSTYLGGSGTDLRGGLALDSTGNAYVTGYTDSMDFPTAGNPYQATFGGGALDAYISKFSPAGALVYSSYFGGADDDRGGAIAVDAEGDIYLSGQTTSVDFPTTLGAYQTTYGGAIDLYIAKLDTSTNILAYSTFLGGASEDHPGADLAVDGDGNATVTGLTRLVAGAAEFPMVNAVQPVFGGGTWDAFATKLSADGASLVYSTYLGGAGDDQGIGIALDGSGSAHIAGFTSSTDYPTERAANPSFLGGALDGFITKLSPSGDLLLYSSYLGGSGDDFALGVDVDVIGSAYVVGSLGSGGADPAAFLTKLALVPANAIYVWRAPGLNGTPITLAEAERLADFAVAEGIGTIFYDNWGCGILPADPTDPDTFTSLCPTGWPGGSEHQDAMTLASIIQTFHDHGLRVEALYTDNGTRNIGGVQVSRVEEVVLYNGTVPPGQQFDALRLNDETFVCAPQHGTDGPSLDDCTVPLSDPPITVNDFDELEGAVADSGSLPIYMSVGHTWTNTDDLLRLFDGIDVQVAQDNQVGYNTYDGRAIERLSADEICEGNTLSKPVHVTVETYDVKTHLGMSDHNTFYEEGRANMLTTLEELDFTADVTPRDYEPPCPQPRPRGIAYHFYRESYGSPILPGWAPDADGDGIAAEIDLAAGGGLPSQFSDSLLGGTTSGEITDVGNQVLMVANALDSGDGVVVTSLYDEPNDGIVRDQPATVTFNPGVGGDCTATPNPPNPSTLTVKADTQVIVTCSSIRVDVVKGQVEAAFTASDGTVATTTMESGNEVTFEPETATFSAPPDNPDPVVVTVGGEEISVEPGETVNADAAITSVTGPPAPLEVDTVVLMAATLADPDPFGAYDATWDWGDGATTAGTVDAAARTVGGDHVYATPGVYTVAVTVSDDQDGSDTELFEYIVAYDPEAGFVTGGGWFDSPPGALADDPDVVGKANFGYVAKYKKGKTVPDGQTQFQFKAGDLELHSTEYDWLVVTGNDTARFKGTGTINGEGEFKFMIWAHDDPDTIRIKIWSEDEAGNETTVYDTGEDTELGGGNIKVHAN